MITTNRPSWARGWLQLGVVPREEVEAQIAKFIVQVFANYTQVSRPNPKPHTDPKGLPNGP